MTTQLFKNEKAFTLMEALITVAIIGVIGFIMVDILARGFRNTNKTQLLGTIKQNGASALNIIDQTVRNSEAVVCVLDAPTPTITVVKDDKYTRFTFVKKTASTNGYVAQDYPTVTETPKTEAESVAVCSASSAILPVVITDTNPTTGASLESGKFTEVDGSGGKSAVGIEFLLGPGINSSKGFEGQTEPVKFETTVQLR